MSRLPKIPLSVQTDAVVLERLYTVERLFLALVALIAIVTLAGWLSPTFDRFLPDGWMLMKANTALCALLSALSLYLSRSSHPRGLLASPVTAAIVALVALAALLEYVFHISFGLDTLLAADGGSPNPGRMSPQTAIAFAFLSAVMAFLKKKREVTARAADLVVFVLCMFLLVILCGYAFGALHLFGVSLRTRTSPQTLVAFSLLAFVAFARRAEYGIFAVLLGATIGSRIARIASPLALLLPFILEWVRSSIIKERLLSPEYATAMATSMAAALAFGLILVLAWRSDHLQREINDLSLRDELTDLYNRRGFYLLAEQTLRLSQRSTLAFSVLFIDVDNLKQINDSYGHEAGSTHLKEVADLIRKAFRETDVIGRVGGDEFVVAATCIDVDIAQSAQRLELAALLFSSEAHRRYPISFSYGHATITAHSEESLNNLIDRADRAMYECKRQRKMMARQVAQAEQQNTTA